MGLLDNTTQKEYYQGDNFGGYQFVSLDDIITQFEIAYVGENKIIPKIKRIDIAFHAQRALAELSFDTFKSIKSQQIDLPPTLVMPLPHDYVNYTKLSWVDSAGIKHPLYRTNSTSNPFQVRQDDDGGYSFPSGNELLTNSDFSSVQGSTLNDWNALAEGSPFEANFSSTIGVVDGKLTWSYTTNNGYGGHYSHIGAIYQAIDVSELSYINFSADGVVADIAFTNADTTTGTAVGTVRFGISTINPATIGSNINYIPSSQSGTVHTILSSELSETDYFNLNNIDNEVSYVEWTGTENSTKTIEAIDVREINTIYAVGLSFVDTSVALTNGFALKPDGTPNNGTIDSANINSLDNVSVINSLASTTLQAKIGNEKNSSTWDNYKSHTSSENNHDDYEDDTYWPMAGNRYGLDPQHAQVNGSFYVDNRIGRIHFSSNISGKTVILDYISDSLGTDAEMQVHKFAEDAMYKCIAYAILSTSSYGQGIVRKFQRDKFAAVRNAKLRLSSLKLEELTQILRGKSKQIKH